MRVFSAHSVRWKFKMSSKPNKIAVWKSHGTIPIIPIPTIPTVVCIWTTNVGGHPCDQTSTKVVALPSCPPVATPCIIHCFISLTNIKNLRTYRVLYYQLCTYIWTATHHFNYDAAQLACMLVRNAFFLGIQVNTYWTSIANHIYIPLYPICQFGVITYRW